MKSKQRKHGMAKAANGIRRNGEKKSPSGERKSENNGEAAWRNNGGESGKWHGEKSKAKAAWHRKAAYGMARRNNRRENRHGVKEERKSMWRRSANGIRKSKYRRKNISVSVKWWRHRKMA
jgi:hypothetical protein